MCICSLASDTIVTVKLVIRFLTSTLCPDLIMFLMHVMQWCTLSTTTKNVHKCAASPMLTGRGHNNKDNNNNKLMHFHRAPVSKKTSYSKHFQTEWVTQQSSLNTMRGWPQTKVCFLFSVIRLTAPGCLIGYWFQNELYECPRFEWVSKTCVANKVQ